MWLRCRSGCLQFYRCVSLRLLLPRTHPSFSCLHFLMTPLPPPGAVQVPVPHGGSDVLLSTPKCQLPFSEPQGGTKTPFPLFHPPTSSDQDPEHRSVITTIAYPTPGLLLEAGTDSLYLSLTSSLLPYQTVPSSAYPLEPTGDWPVYLKPDAFPLLPFPRSVFHSMRMPSPSGLPWPFLPCPAHLAESSGTQLQPPQSSFYNFSCLEANPFLTLETPASSLFHSPNIHWLFL